MATITDINDSDLISASNEVINANFDNLNTDKIETSYLDTDTTLAANSDSKIPTQKAVKAYADTQGNVNASETTRGIVEEATDAEVTAGTETGSTGAKLFVTPAKLATRLPTYVGTYLEDKVQVVSVPISSAQLLAIHTTPVELIPAPGAGKIIVVDQFTFSFVAGTQYTGGDTLELSYDDLAVLAVDDTVSTGITTSASSSVYIFRSGSNNVDVITAVNKSVELNQVTGNAFATGTGTAKVLLKYRVVTV